MCNLSDTIAEGLRIVKKANEMATAAAIEAQPPPILTLTKEEERAVSRWFNMTHRKPLFSEEET